MRPLVRSLVAGALVAIFSLGSSASGVLASSSGAAQPWSYDFAWDYCFDDVVQVYCFDMKGRMHVTPLPDGTELSTITSRQTTTVYRDGVQVAQSSEVALDRTVFADGGQDSLQSVMHVNYTGDGEHCTFTALLRIVDYEIVIDQWLAPDCS